MEEDGGGTKRVGNGVFGFLREREGVKTDSEGGGTQSK